MIFGFLFEISWSGLWDFYFLFLYLISVFLLFVMLYFDLLFSIIHFVLLVPFYSLFINGGSWKVCLSWPLEDLSQLEEAVISSMPISLNDFQGTRINTNNVDLSHFPCWTIPNVIVSCLYIVRSVLAITGFSIVSSQQMATNFEALLIPFSIFCVLWFGFGGLENK